LAFGLEIPAELEKPAEYAAMTQIYAAVSGGLKDTIEVIKWDIVDRDTGAWNSRLSVEADINAIMRSGRASFASIDCREQAAARILSPPRAAGQVA
jgi:hypothetical protein